MKEIRCDNGSNFVGAQRELKESLDEWNQGRIESELIQHGCKWIFQPPTASSISGVWECLVRSEKAGPEIYPRWTCGHRRSLADAAY